MKSGRSALVLPELADHEHEMHAERIAAEGEEEAWPRLSSPVKPQSRSTPIASTA